MTVLYIAILISLASLGVRAVTDKNMIFYFLRRPFDRMQERKEHINNRLEILVNLLLLNREDAKTCDTTSDLGKKHYKDCIRVVRETEKEIKELEDPEKNDLILYLMKPVFMCSTCMASLHTLIWFPVITGQLFTFKLILVMLTVSFFNTIGWLLVNVMRKFIS